MLRHKMAVLAVSAMPQVSAAETPELRGGNAKDKLHSQKIGWNGFRTRIPFPPPLPVLYIFRQNARLMLQIRYIAYPQLYVFPASAPECLCRYLCLSRKSFF